MGLEDEKRNPKLQEAPLSPEEEAAVRGFRFKTQPELAERWLQRPEQQGRKMEDAVRAERERLSKKTRSWGGVTQPVPDDATLKERLLKREWTE